MALQVWLPLNGTLKSLGLTDIKLTNNGATVLNDGKIGQCYSFDGNAHYMQFDKSLGNIYSGDFTWTVWIRPTDNTRGVIISEYSSTGASNVALELLANRVIRVWWNSSPDWNSGYAIPLNTWSHVAVTKVAGLLRLFVNGVEVAQKTGTLTDRPSTSFIRLGDDYRGGTTVSFKGELNDVRIYDHALSVREIQEIAKGLIAHWTFNDPTPSQGLKIVDSSGYGHHAVCTAASMPVLDTDTPRYPRCIKFDTTAKWARVDYMPSLGDVYTFSWWVNWTGTNNIMAWGYYDGNRFNLYRYGGSRQLYCNTGDGQSNPFYKSGTTILTSSVGTWIHYAVVGDGSSTKIYMNGTLAGTAKTAVTGITGSTLYLNGWNDTTSYKGTNTKISDFRVYSTALTADQVKELYENPVSVCKSGNLMCMEVVES